MENYLAGNTVPTKQAEQICDKHDCRYIYIPKLKIAPWCPMCEKEKLAQEKKETDRANSINAIRANLRGYSLVGNRDEYKHTFDNFIVSDGTIEANIKNQARAIAGKYYKDKSAKFNTLFYGKPGEGKTHLAMAILQAVNQFSDPPQRCLFVNTTSLFLAIRASFNNPQARWTEEYAVEKLSEADLLVVDDLGSESVMGDQGSATRFVQEVLYQVTNSQRRMIITTNLTMKQLKSTYDAKLVSRFLAGSKNTQIDFSGIADKRNI